jgi:hypothetical protein
MSLNLPTQAAVDRSSPVRIYVKVVEEDPGLGPVVLADKVLTGLGTLVSIRIAPEGHLIEYREEPVGGQSGPSPSDPAWFPANLDPRIAAYQLGTRYAAIRCRLGRSYF